MIFILQGVNFFNGEYREIARQLAMAALPNVQNFLVFQAFQTLDVAMRNVVKLIKPVERR